MTDAERAKLFPILLEPYHPAWKVEFERERELILGLACATDITAVNHYGSTAIPGIVAKPCVDILLEVKKETDLSALIGAFEHAGYIFIHYKSDLPPQIMLIKGYTERGFEGQTFHIHVRYPGSHEELIFRDYMIAHPMVSEEYGKLKLALKDKFLFDRDGYTEAKGDFIKNVIRLAKEDGNAIQ